MRGVGTSGMSITGSVVGAKLGFVDGGFVASNDNRPDGDCPGDEIENTYHP